MTRASARRRSRLLAAGLPLVLLPAGQAVAAGAMGTTGAGTDRAASSGLPNRQMRFGRLT
ncbi:hypothetical protein [Streptomyces yanii]|uniref:Uncharacterized protein n=1 Tax=Streptomyces yanii TaxID=78510 RepID=A0ABV5R5H2_9ACTN